METQAQKLYDEIVSPNDDETLSSSHNLWMKRELIKLLHKQLLIAQKEESFKKELQRKKSKPLVNAQKSVSETPTVK
tara:strand:- start:383 stop:613 length:231 start_codon:yes stop_codon:yes gene_type:complete